jgi:NADPH-dependent F420 reductase
MTHSIAIVGGTGDLGRGLAARLAGTHDVLIGSRDAAKAEAAAAAIRGAAGASVSGTTNEDATRICDTAILAIPDLPSDDMLESLKRNLSDKLVISPIVPMRVRGGYFEQTMPSGSAAERLASVLRSRVAGAFHTVPAEKLLRTGLALDFDVPVTADTRDVYEETAAIVSTVSNLRPLYAGPLSTSRMIEAITPMLLNIGRLNKIRSPSIKIVA